MISLTDIFVKGCKDVGAEYVAYYPITPATIFAKRCEKHFTFDVAEDEIAAINMAIGTSIIGKKSFVITSGPGLNLMTEGINYAFMAEVPLVVFDFQRAGPATGIPTKTIPQDIQYINNCIFGVYKNPIFYPRTQKEMYEQTIKAFELAEKLKRPVFVLSDFDTSITYQTEEKLKIKKPKINKYPRKNFYTGLFTINDIYSENTDKLQKYLNKREDEFRKYMV